MLSIKWKTWTLPLVAFAGLALLPIGLTAQDTQSPTGPDSGVGETVIVPKKTAPPPVQPPPKQEKINPDEVFVMKSTTNVVNVDVSVADKNGDPIPELAQKNFKVMDDGVQQNVANFATGEAPMTICHAGGVRQQRLAILVPGAGGRLWLSPASSNLRTGWPWLTLT